MKYLWHALAVILLFAAILAAPAIYEELTRKDPFAPAETAAAPVAEKPAPEKPAMPDMPPQPQPEQEKSSFIGNEGRNTIVLGSGGEVRIDGAHITGMEIFDIANGQHNVVTVLSEGLHGVDHNSIVIKGDADIDTVHLDSTMNWTGPRADTQTFYYFGTDVHGEKFSVGITHGVKVDYNGR